MSLNDKQEKCAQAYLIHGNATEAARVAGYKANSSFALANTGHRLKNDPEVQERIKELEQNLSVGNTLAPQFEQNVNFLSLFKVSSYLPDSFHLRYSEPRITVQG